MWVCVYMCVGGGGHMSFSRLHLRSLTPGLQLILSANIDCITDIEVMSQLFTVSSDLCPIFGTEFTAAGETYICTTSVGVYVTIATEGIRF